MPTVFKGLQFRTIASLLSLAEIFRRVDTPKISRTVRSAPLHRCGNDLRHGPKASRRYGRTGRTQAGRIFALPFEGRCRLCLTPSHALSKISPNATKSGPGMARASYSRAIWCHDCQVGLTGTAFEICLLETIDATDQAALCALAKLSERSSKLASHIANGHRSR